MDYFKAGLLVGAVGDVGMQFLAREELLFKDMQPYFQYQGPLCSIAKASLLTGFWSGVYRYGYGKDSLLPFMLFAGIVDIFYRYNYDWLYPSLKTYYDAYPFVNTVAANMGVAGLVYYVNGVL